MLAGAHMSISGGVDKAVIRAAQIGATALQIFLKNNLRWEGAPISRNHARAYHDTLASSPIRSVVAHGCYLVNLCFFKFNSHPLGGK